MKPNKLTAEELSYCKHDVENTMKMFNRYMTGNVFATVPAKESIFQKFINYVKKRQHIKQIKLKEEMCARAIKSKVCSGSCYCCAWSTEEHE